MSLLVAPPSTHCPHPLELWKQQPLGCCYHRSSSCYHDPQEMLGVGKAFSSPTMDLLWCLQLILLHQATRASHGPEESGAVGRSVTFHLQNLDGRAAAWSFHNEIIVIVKPGSPPETTFFDDSYKPRLVFSKNGSALTILQLRMDDAGTYTAKISNEKTFFFTLRVYKELVVPRVTCLVRNCSARGCSYILSCSASSSGSGNISYSWSLGDQLWRNEPRVLVEGSPPGEPSPLTCTARNPVSTRNVTVTSPATLCTGSSSEAGADYSTVYAEVGPSQQVQLQSFNPAGQDDTKKTPTPDVETSRTIYFTVQATAQTDDEKMGKELLEQDKKNLHSLVS
ncbi:T-lymphocyte surface antigen Ly-9 [Apus apus]|uniref:T-lymphocyte surface antigen Ly-9 n=1 Tax=Apus apus TaxID=8895 RepID=UPI0021F8F629|nr:T-lymphocyte surface antigen Ly-9 [Apus apus]